MYLLDCLGKRLRVIGKEAWVRERGFPLQMVLKQVGGQEAVSEQRVGSSFHKGSDQCCQDLTELFTAVMSATRKTTELHLNQTFESTKLFTELGRLDSGMNFPARHGLIVFVTLS